MIVILSNDQVPYCEHVTTLQKLIEVQPGKESLQDLIELSDVYGAFDLGLKVL